MNSLDRTVLRRELGEHIFALPSESENENESSRFIWKEWNVKSLFVDKVRNEPKNHFIALALYSIPILGTAIKINDGILFAIDFGVRFDIESHWNFKAGVERFKDNVAELQVNDVIYFVTRVIYLVAFAVLGIITVTTAVDWGLFFTLLLVCSLNIRSIFADAGLSSTFKEIQKVDLVCLRKMLGLSKSRLREREDLIEAKNLYVLLHRLFRYKVEDVEDEAKKIFESGLLERIQEKTCISEAEKLPFMYIGKRLEAIKDL